MWEGRFAQIQPYARRLCRLSPDLLPKYTPHVCQLMLQRVSCFTKSVCRWMIAWMDDSAAQGLAVRRFSKRVALSALCSSVWGRHDGNKWYISDLLLMRCWHLSAVQFILFLFYRRQAGHRFLRGVTHCEMWWELSPRWSDVDAPDKRDSAFLLVALVECISWKCKCKCMCGCMLRWVEGKRLSDDSVLGDVLLSSEPCCQTDDLRWFSVESAGGIKVDEQW